MCVNTFKIKVLILHYVHINITKTIKSINIYYQPLNIYSQTLNIY